MNTKFPGWTVIRELDAGGQGQTFLATKLDFEESMRSLAQGVTQANAAVHNSSGYSLPDALRMFRQGLKAFLDDDKGRGFGVIKIMKPRKGESDSTAKEKMRDEANAYQRVNHPHLLRLIEEHVDDGYIVTEYQPGGTLGKRLENYRENVVLALDDLIPVIEAVVELHARGVIHRDIKPDNIFIAGDGRLILGDAGIAFFAENEETRKTNTFDNVGTHAFMPLWAQERRIENVPPTFDVYCLAKLLWCMVAGQPTLAAYYFDRKGNNLEERFPRRPEMKSLNALLGLAIVEDEEDMELRTAADLLAAAKQVREGLAAGREILVDPNAERKCGVCCRGVYRATLPGHAGIPTLSPNLFVFSCTHCGHVQTFLKGVAMWKGVE